MTSTCPDMTSYDTHMTPIYSPSPYDYVLQIPVSLLKLLVMQTQIHIQRQILMDMLIQMRMQMQIRLQMQIYIQMRIKMTMRFSHSYTPRGSYNGSVVFVHLILYVCTSCDVSPPNEVLTKVLAKLELSLRMSWSNTDGEMKRALKSCATRSKSRCKKLRQCLLGLSQCFVSVCLPMSVGKGEIRCGAACGSNTAKALSCGTRDSMSIRV